MSINPNNEARVQTGCRLSWVMQGQERQMANIGFSLVIDFVNIGGNTGIMVDMEKSNVPAQITVAQSNAKMTPKVIIFGKYVHVEFENHSYELFQVQDVGDNCKTGTLYFHAFPPAEFVSTMGGHGWVYETPVMYQESAPKEYDFIGDNL